MICMRDSLYPLSLFVSLCLQYVGLFGRDLPSGLFLFNPDAVVSSTSDLGAARYATKQLCDRT